MIDLLKELHDESFDSLNALKFSKRDELSRTIVSLYCTLIEQSWSLLLLVNQGRGAGTSAILRSILEAHIDIENLLSDGRYLKNLSAAYHKEWLKFLREGAAGVNPYLAGMSSVADLETEIARHEARLAELEHEGFKPLKLVDAFKRVGMEHAYRSAYRHLSRESHNNISSLTGRHFERSGENDFNLVIYRNLQATDFEVELDSAAGALIRSGLGVHRHFESQVSSVLEALQEKLFAYRKARDGS